jgi:hypothetical protein
MLEFEKLDLALEQAVGAPPIAVLRAASPKWADGFLFARERLSELSEVATPSERDLLERDRLASFFGCAYGDHGFLARAGALHTVQLRAASLGEALPRLAQEHTALGALRREASILRALCGARLTRPAHDDDLPLLASLDALELALARLADFTAGVAQAGRSVGIAVGAGRLYGLADLTNVASDFREGLSLAGVLSFVLGRLADRGFTEETRSLLHELCVREASSLREALWQVGLEGFERRGQPATLRELRELDVALEQLRAELCSPRRAAADRAETLVALHVLLALGRALGAGQLAARMLDGAVLLIAEGLAAETRQP